MRRVPPREARLSFLCARRVRCPSVTACGRVEERGSFPLPESPDFLVSPTLPYSIDQIFRDNTTRHRLTLFRPADIDWLEDRIFDKNGKPYVRCLASERDRPAKPEEIVRQLWLKKLLDEYGYPKSRIEVERAVWFGSGVSDKAADIVVLHSDGEHPYIIFEVKKPKRRDGEQQLRSYCNAEGSPIGVWSNGEEQLVLHRQEPNIFQAITSIPALGQTLQDVISEAWTIDKLREENKLVKERVSLKDLILDLENLVLANAEGIDDTFDEVFKLIYAKLYDEWAATNDPARNRQVQFRIYGESPTELYDKINRLFVQAKDKWRGIFGLDDRIRLRPAHLLTCVSFLQDIKLFNANLQVIDEAFEYLITDVAKGKKGQYFTPRWVIDMAVRVMHPRINERVIDTACGSSGFTVHSIFHVAGERFTAEGLPPNIVEYAASMVYAIDSSPKAVKIAKALNLIAGDGKTNVYELNSLNPPKWSELGKAAFRPLLTRFPGDAPNDEANQQGFQDFDFDLVLTNPPFAGKISERDVLRQYRLAEKNGRTRGSVGRDILFVERNIRFLRPGGRMAIVLPQGRLNNTTDLYLRNFLFDKARLVGVVGLHPNTFKPHTGTKTSMVFVQKYTAAELARIRDVKAVHSREWGSHLAELRALPVTGLAEETLPELFRAFVAAQFAGETEEGAEEVNDASDPDTDSANESEEELAAQLASLEKQRSEIGRRAAGRKAVAHAIAIVNQKLAACSIETRVTWFLDNTPALEEYQHAWLEQRAAVELNYSVFFAVSERGGKDNSGNPVYLKDEDGGLLLDEHGHLAIDHDLFVIADEFIAFCKAQGLSFWAEA